MLETQLPATAGIAGTVEFNAPQGGLTLLGIREVLRR
jgi:hypothetical protein